MTLAVAIAAGCAAVAAAVWPYVPKFSKPSGLSASGRAAWVNRLFSLAAVADEAGDSAVAEASRHLIATLVNPSQTSAKRGR